MPAMTKANAREMLQRTLSRFKHITGEQVAVVFTWNGSLSILGNSSFTKFADTNKEEIWQNLAAKSFDTKPTHDLEMASKMEGDLKGSSVMTLRRMVSWITQKSTGNFC